MTISENLVEKNLADNRIKKICDGGTGSYQQNVGEYLAGVHQTGNKAVPYRLRRRVRDEVLFGTENEGNTREAPLEFLPLDFAMTRGRVVYEEIL